MREDFLSFSRAARWSRHTQRFHLYTSKKLLYASLGLFVLALTVRGKRAAYFKSVGGLRTRLAGEHRRMIKTERGYIGLAPRLAKAGDQIGLFRGGSSRGFDHYLTLRPQLRMPSGRSGPSFSPELPMSGFLDRRRDKSEWQRSSREQTM